VDLEAEDYDFARVRYFPRDDRWEVTAADGIMRLYGDGPTARQYGVYWGGPKGNWTGASVQLGQQQFTLAWNLSAVRNAWGDAIAFA
jgi:hypothetical protein